jgi:hypothetical protein
MNTENAQTLLSNWALYIAGLAVTIVFTYLQIGS